MHYSSEHSYYFLHISDSVYPEMGPEEHQTRHQDAAPDIWHFVFPILCARAIHVWLDESLAQGEAVWEAGCCSSMQLESLRQY